MAASPASPLAESIAATQAWWREAGVDLVFHDEPHGWLAEPKPEPEAVAIPAEAPAPPPRPRLGGDQGGWPKDLAAFRAWWLEEPSLDRGGSYPRIAPRGETAAQVMFVVPMPEEVDTESLLAGPEGRLLASFATAAGLAPDGVYWSAALPRHTPLPDWDGLRTQGLGDVLLHHLELVAPARVIVFGRNVSPLFGHDPAQAAPAVSEIAIQDRSVPLLTTYAPGRLLEHPRLRKELWQRWLDWTDEG
jgi:DNA polymerase